MRENREVPRSPGPTGCGAATGERFGGTPQRAGMPRTAYRKIVQVEVRPICDDYSARTASLLLLEHAFAAPSPSESTTAPSDLA
jgi:hypothetical protein